MAAVMRSSVLALFAVLSEADRPASVIDVDVGLDPAPPHLGFLAARGTDLEAFRAAVEANTRNAGALLEVSPGLAAPNGWPKEWSGKLDDIPTEGGSGSSGQDFVVTLKCSRSKVAVKKVSKEKAEEELERVQAFKDYPNFISYFTDAKGSDEAYYIMMEATSGGALDGYIKPSHAGAQSPHAGALFLGMLRGVKQMHDARVTHRNLNPQNVLLSNKCGENPPCSAKIINLELACSEDEGWSMRRFFGGLFGGDSRTPQQVFPKCSANRKWELVSSSYRPPESFDPQCIDPWHCLPRPSNDVWALGLILYEMLFAELPKPMATLLQPKTEQQYFDVGRGLRAFDIEKDGNFQILKKTRDEKPEQLMKGMLRLDPEQHLSAAQLMEGMLKINYEQRLSARHALEIAEKLKWGGSTVSDEVAKLPSCFTQS